MLTILWLILLYKKQTISAENMCIYFSIFYSVEGGYGWLTPFSQIIQLYRQFYWWRKQETTEQHTSLLQTSEKHCDIKMYSVHQNKARNQTLYFL